MRGYKLATNGTLEELLQQIEKKNHIVNQACDSCHTSELIGLNKLPCNSAFCIAKQVVVELAQENYSCLVGVDQNGIKITRLTNTYGEKWKWYLLYYDELDFMLIKTAEEFCPLEFDIMEYISMAELCQKLGWF